MTEDSGHRPRDYVPLLEHNLNEVFNLTYEVNGNEQDISEEDTDVARLLEAYDETVNDVKVELEENETDGPEEESFYELEFRGTAYNKSPVEELTGEVFESVTDRHVLRFEGTYRQEAITPKDLETSQEETVTN